MKRLGIRRGCHPARRRRLLHADEAIRTMELIARVEALLRRVPPPAARSADCYRFGPVEVDFRRAEVVRDGKPVVLSAREFQLLHYLLTIRGLGYKFTG
jgi:DNA-binding response OmpR family regulator